MDGSFARGIGEAFSALFAIAVFALFITIGAVFSFIALLFGFILTAKILLGLGFICGGAFGTFTYLR